MAVVATAGCTTRLTSSLARTAASEKALGPLDVIRDFGSPRPWDPWFGGLQGRADLHFMAMGAGMGTWAVGRAGGKDEPMVPSHCLLPQRHLWFCPPASDKVCQTLKSSHFFS